MESKTIETKQAWFARRVELVADEWVMKRFEMHSNLVGPACFWFSFNKSNTFILRSFKYLEIRNGLSFLSSRPAFGGPFFKIRNTSTYRQVNSSLVIFEITVDKKMVDFVYLSFL